MKKKGFTLIEMMLALAIFSLFVGFLYNAYFSQIRENASFNNRLDLKYNGDKAMNLILDTLRSNIGLNYTFVNGSTTNINKVTNSTGTLIDLTGGASSLTLRNQGNSNELVDESSPSFVVLCKKIASISIQTGTPAQNEADLLLVTITLQSKNDTYSVTSGVNISK